MSEKCCTLTRIAVFRVFLQRVGILWGFREALFQSIFFVWDRIARGFVILRKEYLTDTRRGKKIEKTADLKIFQRIIVKKTTKGRQYRVTCYIMKFVIFHDETFGSYPIGRRSIFHRDKAIFVRF